MGDNTRKDDLMLLGSKIRAERLRKGFNQTEFANMIGKDQPSLARIENGNINPGYLTLLDIAKGLDIEIKDLL